MKIPPPEGDGDHRRSDGVEQVRIIIRDKANDK